MNKTKFVFQRNGVRTTDYILPKPYLAAIRQHWMKFADEILPYPNDFEGKGIVICAGGKTYFTCCWVLLSTLRHELKCGLPIEVWYRGDEITPELEEALRIFGVTTHNVEDYYPMTPGMSGYVMKPMSILFSRFKEVLFLDADNVCAMNPESLFEWPEYKKYGAVFWPDFWTTSHTNQIWEILGVVANDNKEQESGQLLIDKERCWRELNLALYFNMNSHIYYNYLVGDKDTFRFAWLALKKEVYFINHEVGSCGYIDADGIFVGHTMVQHTPDGEIAFLHRNLLKWDKTDERILRWKIIKQFEKNAMDRKYIMYRDVEKRRNIMDIGGDVMVYDFKSLFGDLEDRCLLYLKKLRGEEFYKRLI